jgi:hypothetical protein
MPISRVLNQVLLASSACVALFAAAPVAWSSVPIPLTTVASPDVTLSGSMVMLTDGAILSGGVNPGGTITFMLTTGGPPIDTETVTVNGDGTYTTPTGFTLPTTGTVVGTYSWTVSYSGDPDNSGVTALPEPTVVSAASPGLDTTALIVGSTLTDSAQLSGDTFPGERSPSC